MALENAFSLFEDSKYEEIFPSVRILGDTVDYFVQCNTYEVLVPSHSVTEQRLDIFEDAVKLTSVIFEKIFPLIQEYYSDVCSLEM